MGSLCPFPGCLSAVQPAPEEHRKMSVGDAQHTRQHRSREVPRLATPAPLPPHTRSPSPAPRLIFLTLKHNHAMHANVPQPLPTSPMPTSRQSYRALPCPALHAPPPTAGHLGLLQLLALPRPSLHLSVLHPSLQPTRHHLFSCLPELPPPCPVGPLTPLLLKQSIPLGLLRESSDNNYGCIW